MHDRAEGRGRSESFYDAAGRRRSRTHAKRTEFKNTSGRLLMRANYSQDARATLEKRRRYIHIHTYSEVGSGRAASERGCSEPRRGNQAHSLLHSRTTRYWRHRTTTTTITWRLYRKTWRRPCPPSFRIPCKTPEKRRTLRRPHPGDETRLSYTGSNARVRNAEKDSAIEYSERIRH